MKFSNYSSGIRKDFRHQQYPKETRRHNLQPSSHIYFDTQPANPDDVVQDITFFMLESDDKKIADERLQAGIQTVRRRGLQVQHKKSQFMSY
ncbi:hypothetical protein [Methanobrevibacter sp. UBA212]|uniref:hypothetical protein n=1 Tax=Methanobrevibacter sp. UBA212 TaxID=1915476 RepID=UPI0025EFCCC8|nr:hypothetical protein [Methanobrevibacter sp. UBA212]